MGSETIIIFGQIEYSSNFNMHRAHIKTIEGVYRSSTKEEHVALLETLEGIKKPGMDTFMPDIYKGEISVSKKALKILLN